MSWTKQTKADSSATTGWGSMQWGVDAWGGDTATGWVNQSDASDSWTLVSAPNDSWTKQTKAS